MDYKKIVTTLLVLFLLTGFRVPINAIKPDCSMNYTKMLAYLLKGNNPSWIEINGDVSHPKTCTYIPCSKKPNGTHEIKENYHDIKLNSPKFYGLYLYTEHDFNLKTRFCTKSAKSIDLLHWAEFWKDIRNTQYVNPKFESPQFQFSQEDYMKLANITDEKKAADTVYNLSKELNKSVDYSNKTLGINIVKTKMKKEIKEQITILKQSKMNPDSSFDRTYNSLKSETKKVNNYKAKESDNLKSNPIWLKNKKELLSLKSNLNYNT